MSNNHISVLMSIWAGTDASFFDQSIKSIALNQSLLPGELVIVIDGQLSNAVLTTLNKLKKEVPVPIQTVPLGGHHGLGYALNEGIRHCKFELIARMDDDDIARPDRLQLQWAFMNKNPNVAVLGGQIAGWDRNFSKKVISKHLPTDDCSLRKWTKFRCPFNHPTVMFRKSCVLACGGYSPEHPEDYSLWFRIIETNHRVANLPDILVDMRVSDAISKRRGVGMLKGELKLFIEMYRRGFTSFFETVFNIVGRTTLRLAPTGIRTMIYRLFS